MKKQDSLKVAKKRNQEKLVVSQMITLYCYKKHGLTSKDELCPECKKLCEYAQARSEYCPFMEKKTFCANCRVHCYRSDMRERIREVMRFAGPRMILYHPWMAIWHLISTKWESYMMKRKKRKEDK